LVSNASRLRRLRPHIIGLIAVLLVGGIVYLAGTDRLSLLGSRSTSASAGLTPSSPPIDRLRAAAAGANLVICVIDAARADHVGCCGYARKTTPNIDRLANRGLLFEQHFCQYPDTKPSTASLFTGQYPDTHLTFGTRKIAQDAFTMARGLSGAGFDTAFFSSNSWASAAMGMAEDFDVAYVYGDSRAQDRASAEGGSQGPRVHVIGSDPQSLLDVFSEWLAGRSPSRFFAYLHFMPPHYPYVAPEEMKSRFTGRPPGFSRGPFPFPEVAQPGGPSQHDEPDGELVNLYDANFLYADWAVGRVEAILRDAEVLDDTLFIVTADHGEALGEHGYAWHTICPYDEALHIPLIVLFPGSQPPSARITALTQTIDLLPTTLDLFAIPWPREAVQGRSLLPVLAGRRAGVNRYLFARSGGRPACSVVRDRDHTLLLYEGGKLRALYDLHTDPGQTSNIVDADPERAAELASAFCTFARAQAAPPLNFVDPGARRPPLSKRPRATMTDEMREHLKSLGYLQ